MSAVVFPKVSTSAEVAHWTRILEITRLPFRLERARDGRLELHHTTPQPGTPWAAAARAAAAYALMDVNDVVGGRAWSPAICKRCKGSAFGYTHTGAICAAISQLGRELGGKGAPATAPRVI